MEYLVNDEESIICTWILIKSASMTYKSSATYKTQPQGYKKQIDVVHSSPA